MKRKILALVFLIAVLQSVSAAVTLSANTPDPIHQGESATLTVTATASGTSASNVTITIGLPSGLSTSSSTSQMIASIQAGQSQSVSWTVTGDNASSQPYTITFNASGGATANTTTQLSVITPAYIEVSNTSCPSTTASVGDDLSVSFVLKNTGGDSTNAQAQLSYSTAYLNKKSGPANSWQQDINAGGQVALNYDFNAIDAGTATITVQITSNQNNPDDISCTVTISAVAGDSICSTGETDSGSNNGCASGYKCSNGSCVAVSTATCGDGTCQSTETCSSCPADCGTCTTNNNNAGSSGASTAAQANEKRETILEKTFKGKPTGEELKAILERAGASKTAIEKAVAAVEKTSVTRAFKVEKVTVGSKVSYTTTITITVENKSGKKMQNVKVVETIPKNVIETLKEEDINSDTSFKILKADPIIEFTVPSIEAGKTASLEYAIGKDVNEEQAASWNKAVVAEFTEETEKCAGIKCPIITCQVGKCNSQTGKCEYSDTPNGAACAPGKECKQGKCVEITQPTPTALPQQQAAESPTPSQLPAGKGPDYTWLIILVIVSIVIGAVAFMLVMQKMEEKKTPLQKAAEHVKKGEKNRPH